MCVPRLWSVDTETSWIICCEIMSTKKLQLDSTTTRPRPRFDHPRHRSTVTTTSLDICCGILWSFQRVPVRTPTLNLKHRWHARGHQSSQDCKNQSYTCPPINREYQRTSVLFRVFQCSKSIHIIKASLTSREAAKVLPIGRYLFTQDT